MNKNDQEVGYVSPVYVVFEVKSENLDVQFLFKLLKSVRINQELVRKSRGAVRSQLKFNDLAYIKILLPPLQVQQRIVDTIETKKRAIDAAKDVIAALDQNRKSFGDKVAKINGMEWVELGEVANLISGGTPSKTIKNYWNNGEIKWLSAKHINEENQVIGYDLITKDAIESSTTNIIQKGSQLFL